MSEDVQVLSKCDGYIFVNDIIKWGTRNRELIIFGVNI